MLVFISRYAHVARFYGLSEFASKLEIQIQIIIFIAYHKRELCNVSLLAKEFNVTKPTVSDAIKVLGKKEMIIKDFSSSDSRSYSIILSELESLLGTLSQLIYKLNRNGILRIQRTCYGCKFYERSQEVHYCNLLQKELSSNEIRLDCPEYEEKASG